MEWNVKSAVPLSVAIEIVCTDNGWVGWTLLDYVVVCQMIIFY